MWRKRQGAWMLKGPLQASTTYVAGTVVKAAASGGNDCFWHKSLLTMKQHANTVEAGEGVCIQPDENVQEERLRNLG